MNEMTKKYMAPLMTVRNVETASSLLAFSNEVDIDYGGGNGSDSGAPGVAESNGHRGRWGDLWGSEE